MLLLGSLYPFGLERNEAYRWERSAPGPLFMCAELPLDGSLHDWYAETPPGPEASGIVAGLVRESQKQTGIKYAQFSLVGASNMLVDVGALNLFLLIGPTRSPELLVLYNLAALVLANANSYLWNTLWTFRHQARHDARQVGMFSAQGLLNAGVGSLLLWLVAPTGSG